VAPARLAPSGEFEGLDAPPPVPFFEMKSTELMRTFRDSGDGDTFDLLYRINAPRIERIVKSCLRYSPRAFDAGEIVQDVFVNIFRSADHFRPERAESFRTWSAQIARNAVRKAMRSRRDRSRERQSALLEVLPARRQAVEEGEVLHAGSLAFPVLLAALWQAFNDLLPRDRAVLQEAEIEHADYGDIARRHGLRPGTVRMVVFRARHRLFTRAESLLLRAAGRSST
jgi:RNA polymerase sigma factor (sigma-70 family)